MKTLDVFSRAALVAWVALLTFLSSPPTSFAQSEEDEDLMDYDQIVRELSHGPTNRAQATSTTTNPFDSVLMHGGVGLASTFSSIPYQGQRIQLHQQGFQAALGIDLFSEHWLAEGTARSFGNAEYNQVNVGLKEFDLKVYYRDRIGSKLGVRAGAGLSARYLTVKSGKSETVYSTPASVLGLGLEYFLGRSVSLGAEVSARNTLIDETIDRSAIDGTLRVDTHF
ncbi:MAG: porin family protein [Bdellovibrionaceae bacterium]|nr:porin family protein [Pseudobdellovibrionaceae bacterium]